MKVGGQTEVLRGVGFGWRGQGVKTYHGRGMGNFFLKQSIG